MTDVIDGIVAEFNKVQKEFQGKAQKALREAFSEFFDANPTIDSIYWTQYAPYFNDGDECFFGVHEMYAVLKDYKVAEGEDEVDEDDYMEDRPDAFDSSGKYGNDEFNTKYQKEISGFKAFTKAINKLPDDIFELTFGNHVEVTATEKGFNVEEYEHD